MNDTASRKRLIAGLEDKVRFHAEKLQPHHKLEDREARIDLMHAYAATISLLENSPTMWTPMPSDTPEIG